MWLVISTIFSKMKDFSRSQAVVYTVDVGNISETVPDVVVITTDYEYEVIMAYR